MEGDGEKVFKQIVLLKIVIALVADLKEIPNLLHCLRVGYVV
jgi:hypothetical protein